MDDKTRRKILNKAFGSTSETIFCEVEDGEDNTKMVESSQLELPSYQQLSILALRWTMFGMDHKDAGNKDVADVYLNCSKELSDFLGNVIHEIK